jgi:glycosyltransferase involved in cell wall biosynthesis
MILSIDGYEANTGSRVGIGRFAYEMLVGIHEEIRAGKSAFATARIYMPSAPISDLPAASDRWQYILGKPQKLWTFLGLPWRLRSDMPQADVVFSPTHYVPRFVRTPRVFSIMDVSYLHYPELFTKKDLYQLTKWTEYSVRHSEKIITISEYSKHAIMEAYNLASDRVVVVYPGMSMRVSKNTPKQTVSLVSKYGIDGPYILSVGTLQPRKNFVRLIEAFSRLEDKSTTLVIVGKKGWMYEEILSAPSVYNVKDRVKILDFVEDDDLALLYSKAECFVLPSLYEGFGLPVLEAMVYGCPIVVSQVSSLPEIAGEAAIYVDPMKVESIASGMSEALKSRGTKEEKNRVQIGKKRVDLFSWKEAAKKVLSVLEEVGSKKE